MTPSSARRQYAARCIVVRQPARLYMTGAARACDMWGEDALQREILQLYRRRVIFVTTSAVAMIRHYG